MTRQKNTKNLASSASQLSYRQVQPPRFSPSRYMKRHLQAALSSLGRIYKSPLASLMTIGVIAIAVALPSAIIIVLGNLKQVGQHWQVGNHITVYLKQDITPLAELAFMTQINAREDISVIRTVSPEEGLAEFETYSGFGDVLAELDGNPLPTVVLVKPSKPNPSQLDLQVLTRELSQSKWVASVQLDLEWVERLGFIISIIARLAIALAGLLLLSILFVIGNTLRMAVENRREEINVIKLVGGTHGFIRRPFLYMGFYYALLGGLLAWHMVALVFFGLKGPIQSLAMTYDSDFRFMNMSLSQGLLLLVCCSGIGILAAWFSVNKQLSEIEPE